MDHVHEKQKVGTARKVTHLAGSPFCDGWITLIWFAQPGQPGQGETSRACANAVARATLGHSGIREHVDFLHRSLGNLTNQIMIPGSGYHEWAASKQRLQALQSFFSLPDHARRFSFSTRSTKKHVRRLLTVKFSRATSYLYNEESFFRLLNLVSVRKNPIPRKLDILSELE